MNTPELAGKVAIVTGGASEAQILRCGPAASVRADARDGAPEVEAA